jgi:hypothetical protein
VPVSRVNQEAPPLVERNIVPLAPAAKSRPSRLAHTECRSSVVGLFSRLKVRPSVEVRMRPFQPTTVSPPPSPVMPVSVSRTPDGRDSKCPPPSRDKRIVPASPTA